MAGGSISLRLILGATLWIAASLIATAFLLTKLFGSYVEQTVDAELNDHIDEILTLSVVDSSGQVRLKRHPVDPRYNKSLSGWYWEMWREGVRSDWSQSLADQRISPSGPMPSGDFAEFGTLTPSGEPLRITARTVTLPGANKPVHILVTAPGYVIDDAVRVFSNTLVLALTLLGLGLIGAVVAQVRFGLRPLKRIRQALSDIRAGKRLARLIGPYPREIRPLTDELNALLEHNATVIERTRSQVADMAHALKTPLTVLTNEADKVEGDAGRVLRDQLTLITERMNHFLSRARIAGAHRVLGARTEVREVAEGLCRALQRLYESRGIGISLEVPDRLIFQGERQDLEEVVGNLIENACKWAQRRVDVWGRREGNHILIGVEDDGPGIPKNRYSDVMDRGQRLDKSVPGSGLGLSIVRDVAQLYGGELSLSDSDLGGLRAQLRLPSA